MKHLKRRLSAASLVLAVAASMLAALAAPALADHPAEGFAPVSAPTSTTFNSGFGEGVEGEWEFLTSIPTGNPHTDLDFFTQGPETFVSVGTLAAGANGGGQTIVQLTEEGEVAPSFVSAHPSATCTTGTGVTGLQHDVEATPKGDVMLNTDFGGEQVTSDAQLLLDTTDQTGRCHDAGPLGGASDPTGSGLGGAPKGGLEIIDITDIDNPVEIGLISHIAEAHTVNVDPRRPHIAYAVSSSAVDVREDGSRENEDGSTVDPETGDSQEEQATGPTELDGWEMVDLSSCMDFPEGTSVDDKRESCRPEVFRFRYDTAEIARGHTNQSLIYGCHELELYPDDRLTCGGGSALMLFDIAGAFDDSGTPGDLTDDTINGDPLPCRVRDSSSTITTTTAKVTDCRFGGTDEEEINLEIPGWLDIGAPSVEGVEHISSAHHQGRTAGGKIPFTRVTIDSAYKAPEDIDFNHETEFTDSERFLIASDERGGGVLPPGATCSPGIDNPEGNGGLHAYATDRLDTERPIVLDEDGEYDAEASAEEAFDAFALTPEGEKAVFQAPIQTAPQATFCTAHVFQQIPGQNRIFMAWYTQGTRVVDFEEVEQPDGSTTLEFSEAGFFIPENANQWVSHIFKVEDNGDGTFTYFGVADDFILGTAGRNAIDIYKVTMTAPPEPLPPVDDDGSGGPGGDPTDPPTEVPTEPPPGAPVVDRIEGGDRVDTAVGVSREAFESAEVATLARADDYADALSGGPLSAELDAPLLLTEVDELSDATAAELERLGASEVVVYGGNEAVSDDVLAELRDDGLTVRRVQGPNRFATAGAVAAELVERTGADGADSAVLVEGFNADPTRGFPDAVSAAPFAAASARPILLAVQDSLPPETADALEALGTTETLVVGGPAAIGEQVVAELTVRGHGPDDRFRSGADRYETSALVYGEAVAEGADPGELFLARGDDFADALVAGPAVAKRDATLLLVDPADLSDSAATERVITDRAAEIDRVVLLGGDMAIADQVEDQVREILTDAQSEQEGSGQESAAAPMSADAGLILLGLTVLPAAGFLGRRRRRT